MGKTLTAGGRSLHVFGALSRGGAETWFLQALAHRGTSPWSADVCLLSSEEGECVPAAHALDLRVLHCSYRPAATFPARFLNLLRRERYDAVHAHVLLFSGVIAALARRAGVPLRAAHAHNSFDGRKDTRARTLYRALMRRLIAENANLVLACSREAAGAFRAPETKILPYGVDLAPYTLPLTGPQDRFGIPGGTPVLGMVGRLTRQKNHVFLLDAFAAAVAQGAEAHLAILGDGPLRGELERRAAHPGIAGRVHFLGLRNDVPRLLMGLCDGFVMPSLYEGLPVALIEAQAAGLPCLIAEGISREAVVLEEQVETLPLEAPMWVERLVRLARKPRLTPAAAAERMRQGGFDACHSWSRLTALYGERLAHGQRAQAA